MSEYDPLDSWSENSFIIKNQFPEETDYLPEDNELNQTNNHSSFKATEESIIICTENMIGNKRVEPDNEDTLHKKEEENKEDNDNYFINKEEKEKLNNNEKTNEVKKPIKTRRKYQKDLILMKVQGHYMTFIIKVINEILDFFNYNKKDRFKDIEHSIKKRIQKENFETLKKKKLYEIITNKVTKKNQNDKSYNEYFNMNLYKYVEKDEVIKNFLNENYLNLFRNIYYEGERNLNLKEYGKDVIITLSEKIQMYNDIEKEDKDYINSLNKYVKKNYFSTNLFNIKRDK